MGKGEMGEKQKKRKQALVAKRICPSSVKTIQSITLAAITTFVIAHALGIQGIIEMWRDFDYD